MVCDKPSSIQEGTMSANCSHTLTISHTPRGKKKRRKRKETNSAKAKDFCRDLTTNQKKSCYCSEDIVKLQSPDYIQRETFSPKYQWLKQAFKNSILIPCSIPNRTQKLTIAFPIIWHHSLCFTLQIPYGWLRFTTRIFLFKVFSDRD